MPEFSEEYIQKLIKSIYDGDVTEYDLPEDLYYKIAEYLKKGLYEGYGGSISSLTKSINEKVIEFDLSDLELLSELRTNIYMFSAAKTFSQVKEMTEKLLSESGTVRPFGEFKEDATEIFDTYNETWLKTEYDTAIGQATEAVRWNSIEKNKDLLPFLRYSAVGDACEICQPLDGITAPVDDPIWDTVAPLNHFNCFPANTKIMIKGGWKYISKFQKGDLVIGGSGKEKDVIGIHVKTFSGEMISITVKNETVTATKDHRFLTFNGWCASETIFASQILIQDVQIGFINKIVTQINNFYVVLAYLLMSVKRKWKSCMVNALNSNISQRDENINKLFSNKLVDDACKPLFSKKVVNLFFAASRGFMILCIKFRVFIICFNSFIISLFSCFQIKHRIVNFHSYACIGARNAQSWLWVSLFKFFHLCRSILFPFVSPDPLKLYSIAFIAKSEVIVSKQSNQSSIINSPLFAYHGSRVQLGKVDAFDGFATGYPFNTFDTLNNFLCNAFFHRKFVFVKSVKKIDYTGQIYNLSVNNDESYITNVGVVHNCLCILEQLDEKEGTEKETPEDERKETVSSVEGKMNDVFKMNAGRDGYVFKEDHPYFTVPKEDKEFAKDNFDLPIPKKD